ncbi:PKD domain-containing protein [Haloarchaeobius sp. DYHT-AS-18]|uniref:PKD domain-containing protein n=1 Tax=Haloarchaeobius sp. DYHT-AS-18 TaxID=3446117 RepID=UPI003EB92EC4
MRALHLAVAVVALVCLLFAAPAAAESGSVSLQENESGSPDVVVHGPETAVYNYSENFSVSVAGADIESVTWQFPDGSTATGTEANYRFMQEGNRTITVVVETTDGETLRESVTYDVFRYHDDGWDPLPSLQFWGLYAFYALVIIGMGTLGVPLVMRSL